MNYKRSVNEDKRKNKHVMKQFRYNVSIVAGKQIGFVLAMQSLLSLVTSFCSYLLLLEKCNMFFLYNVSAVRWRKAGLEASAAEVLQMLGS